MKLGIMLPHSGALAGVEGIRRAATEAEDLDSFVAMMRTFAREVMPRFS